MPTVEEIRSGFDEEAEYAKFLTEFKLEQERCGDMLWCPADWWMIPTALWYAKFGYETALMTLGLYPDRYRKLIQTSAERRPAACHVACACHQRGHSPARHSLRRGHLRPDRPHGLS